MKTKTLFWSVSIIAVGFIAGGSSASGQSAGTPSATDTDEIFYQPFETKLEIGPTTGVGISESWRFMSHLGIRGGVDYFPYNYSGTIKDVRYNLKLRYQTEPITLDWYPWAEHSFHVSGGIVLNQNRLSGSGSGGNSTITINGNQYQTSQIGTLNVAIKQEPVNPYASIGGNFCYFDQARHWAFGWELGAMYTGNSRVSFSQSGGTVKIAASDISAEQAKLQRYANDLKFWPVLKLGLSFGF